MFRELLSILRPGNPLSAMAHNFSEMLRLTCEMCKKAGDIYFHKSATLDDRDDIYQKDVRVNKLERTIRKQVVAHLSSGRNTPDLPYCLLLMTLVKDIERVGDYAKNLSEVVDIYSGPLPEDEFLGELTEIREGVEEAFAAVAEVFDSSDRDRAMDLIRQGKDSAKRADELLASVARSNHKAGETAAIVLGARYYKRIGGHVLNLLTSVVMPLHKVDYYDEDEIQ